MKKKKTIRSKDPHSSLNKRFNTRIRQEYIDMDYLHKLDDTKKIVKLPNGEMVTEKEYLSLFMNEWNNASVAKQSKSKKNKFHRTAKQAKTCTDRNNDRNRDQYGRAKAQNLMAEMDEETFRNIMEKEVKFTSNITEDALIDVLDEMEKLRNTSENTDNDGQDTK